MKGYRFYEELENKNRKGERSQGLVIAVLQQGNGRGWSPVYVPTRIDTNQCVMEAIASVYDEPNSPVCGSSVSWGYLRDTCKRVSEKRAREIHPQLFKYLDS